MQDNFDLKGYLRHGNKLLNEGIGGYVDLYPVKEETENEAAYFAEDEMQELEKPEKIYADDDGEDDDRFWDNWGKGDQIMSDLKSAGFDVEDVVDFIKSHWHRY